MQYREILKWSGLAVSLVAIGGLTLFFAATSVEQTDRDNGFPRYRCELISKPGMSVGMILDLNDEGTAVGMIEPREGQKRVGFIFDKQEIAYPALPDFGEAEPYAWSIQSIANDGTLMASIGSSSDATSDTLVATYVGGKLEVHARYLNTEGAGLGSGDFYAVAFRSDTSENQIVVWEDGEPRQLTELQEEHYSIMSVSPSGDIVGCVQPGVAFTARRTGASHWELDILNDFSSPKKINSHGTVLIKTRHDTYETLSIDGGRNRLPPLNTQTRVIYPWDMNDKGHVVGVCYQGKNKRAVAVLWTKLGPVDLNRVIANKDCELLWATAINNRGQIGSYGRYRGEPALFILSP